MKLAAVILLKDEEVHIERCIESIKGVVDEIIIIDSYSTDKSVCIAEKYDAKIFQNSWINYSNQFNFGISKVPCDCDWILRIDADERLVDNKLLPLRKFIQKLPDSISGIELPRKIIFMNELVRYGGINTNHTLRIFKRTDGKCEARWMDEHIIVSGDIIRENKYTLYDHNLKSLSWWLEKHNNYSSREAVDILNIKYKFIDRIDEKTGLGRTAKIKRIVKEKIYSKMPLTVRSFIYFFLRYIILLGFLDKGWARKYHILQGLWYRSLVDAKVSEVESRVAKGEKINEAILRAFNIRI